MPTRAKKTTTPKEPSKKKTKTPIKVVATITPDGIEGSFVPENRRPLIAHLRVHSHALAFTEGPSATANAVEPEPYNPMGDNLFAGEQALLETKEIVEEKPKPEIYTAATEAQEHRPIQCYSRVDLMVQYRDTARAKVLPASVDIACFWCAHKFQGAPCVIPEREVAGVYNVYGNFCCPECSLAYVLNETIDPHVRWERIALLHRIYDADGKNRLFPSPVRETLQLFGGPLTIESFRATIRQNKVRVDLHMPPMVSILGSIDTKPIDFFDTNMKNTMIGTLQQEKTERATEGLRLKRNKPLKDRESTLDSVMSINIKTNT